MALVEVIDERYEVTARLGQGGMGEVWRANDRLLGRQVAIKFVHERQLRETPGAAKILEYEAKTAGRLLGLPGIVSVLDMVSAATDLHHGPAIVMEYVDGCNLAEWIVLNRASLDETTALLTGLYICLEIVDSIGEAHNLGILHRDIKPHNVLCSLQGRVKVADFGLARLVEAITRSHTVWANHTPLYAAPEQWRDEKPDRDTDIYQLCGTIYHILAGTPANKGRSALGLMQWQQTSQVVPLKEVLPGIDEKVQNAIHRGLENDKEARPNAWEIFDVISAAIMKPVTISIDFGGCTEEQVEAAKKLTNIAFEARNEPRTAINYPNPLEGLRECIGMTLIGLKCSVSV